MAKLEETFGALPLWLAAENGVYVRPPVRPDLPQVGLCFMGELRSMLLCFSDSPGL